MRNWINLCEGKWWDNGETVTLYHGTSSALEEVIRKHGLLPPNEDIKLYAHQILGSYIPEERWTRSLLTQVEEHAIRPYARAGERGSAVYCMARPQDVEGYAKSYAEHGGEIAYNVWECACIFLTPGRDERSNKVNPPVKPRFENARPIIVQMEVPKTWCEFNNSFDSMKTTCDTLWRDGVEWARECGSIEALYDDVFDEREVFIPRAIPFEMITDIIRVP